MYYKVKSYKLRARRYARKVDKKYRYHPRIVPILAGVSVLFIALILVVTLRDSAITIKKTDADIVILHADQQTKVIPTRAETVGDFLESADIDLHEGDVVEPDLGTAIQEDDFRINIYRGMPLIVQDGEARIRALSAALTPRSAVEQAGLTVFPEDIIEAGPSMDFIRDGIGTKVTVKRSIPATLNLYGTPLALRTHARTVGDLLKEKNVQLLEGDEVTPSADTALAGQTQVFVTRHGTQLVSEEEAIAMPTETVLDTSLSFGTSAVRQKGAPGKKSVTYQLELKNGVETGRTKIQEVIVQEPVMHIIARGQAISIPSDKEALMRSAGIAASDFPYANYIINHENGMWCPTRWQGQNFCPEYYQEKFPGAESHTSTGYGMCQATPGNKMAANGSDWRTSATTQLKWCSGYATSRYGGWKGAYEAWTAREAQGRGWW